MSPWIPLAFMMGAVAVAGAQDLGVRMPAKSAPVVAENVPDPDRQGGDTILDAWVIPAIPYTDIGTTAGYVDDYDEACPYTGSTSPDVVYSFTPAVDLVVNLDLCGSSYDTKIYVYDSALHLVACNDDYYFDDVCGLYVSKLPCVWLTPGQTYYIVIDGYGGDFGEYILDVTSFEGCVVECPTGAWPENEPELVDDYADSWNGGCDSPGFGFPFQHISGDEEGAAVFCGVAGWYIHGGVDSRDTDWFTVMAGPTGTIDVTVDAEAPTLFCELLPQDCEDVAVAQSVSGGPCSPATMAITGYPETAVVWLWAGSTGFWPEPCVPGNEYDYVLWISGIAGSVNAGNTSWSRLKALYE